MFNRYTLVKYVTGILFLLFLLFFSVKCTETKDQAQLDMDDTIIQIQNQENDRMMNTGPDPVFVNYESNDSKNNILARTIAQSTTSWERLMYIDKTDTIYTSSTASKRLAGYLKKYGFRGVYLYSTSGIVSSSSNFINFATFIKTLSDSGIAFRGVANGSSTTFQSTGNISKYNSSQSDTNKRINRANLELEWWNGATTWNNWNSLNQQIANGTIRDNDFYEGWYKNMGTTIDTIAAKDQVLFSDRVLLHCYQNGIPTYSYANAQSSEATAGRLDIIAKGARQANKKIDLFIIISSESTAWGASNTFTGPALANAYIAGQPNPYYTIESQAYNNIFNSMTTFQKQWINFKGFVWFTKRYCYRAVPPQ
jgi:hypothetical protein